MKAVSQFPAVSGRRAHSLAGELIVSLTSYPARFATLGLTLKSLLDQSVRPDRTILWLGHGDSSLLPADVTTLAVYGLEIRETDDLRSFTKLVPALELFPDAYIVTADDDIYYPPDWLERLVVAGGQHLGAIVGIRSHLASYDDHGALSPYARWELGASALQEPDATRPLFLTGVAGVLYPPRSLSSEVLDSATFMRLCPFADDVWFFWMSEMKGTKRLRAPGPNDLVTWAGSQDVALHLENLYGNRNDEQIRAMEDHYGLFQTLGPLSVGAVVRP